MAISAAEQYLLELINRGRLDPAADAARYNVALNAGLPGGTISTAAKQVLASNSVVEEAAARHSQWMLNADKFSHDGPGGSDAGDRMAVAGYDFTQPGKWSWGENLSFISGSGGTETMMRGHYAQLYRSAGHREHTFDEDVREIGIGEVTGKYQSSSGSMVTENFAMAGPDVFVTGVAYRDKNNNDFYNIGEGRGGLRITADGDGATTAKAGGYAIGISPDAQVDIKVEQGSKVIGTLVLDASSGNAKLDLVQQGNGVWEVALSASATLQSGIAHATLLGVAGLDLTGTGGGNRLTGNKGANVLDGGNGNDTLRGGNGHDTLLGGNGNDVLLGGNGRDRLEGGAGRDRLDGGGGPDMFVFRSASDSAVGGNRDTITGFKRGPDHVDLTGIDADSTSAGDQAFTFIGTKGFSDAGQLRYFSVQGGVVAAMDIDGDGGADMHIFLRGLGGLGAGDFLL